MTFDPVTFALEAIGATDKAEERKRRLNASSTDSGLTNNLSEKQKENLRKVLKEGLNDYKDLTSDIMRSLF